MKEIVAVITGIICCLAICFLIFASSVYVIRTQFTEANYIVVKVDDKTVYEGKRAYIRIVSSGYATTVEIYGRLFPIPCIAGTYTAKNVVVK